MNIVYIRWKCFGQNDILEALKNLSHSVTAVDLSSDAETCHDPVMETLVYKAIKNNNAKIVISFNYYPTVSTACMRAGCPYFSWIYDSPYTKMYDKTAANNVNYIGCFDSSTVNELNSLGVSTVHYVPLAVNSGRIATHIAAAVKQKKYARIAASCADIAFVGSLYNESHHFLERLFSYTHDMELIGYLDAIIDAQRKIYGCYILDECLSDSVLDKIRSVMPYKAAEGSYITDRRVYADYYLGPRITYLERTQLLKKMATISTSNLYSGNASFAADGITNMGTVEYYNEMPIVFNRSKINLNCTLRSIKSGIPLRAMDIMGAGGFLLTNYQEDFFKNFEAGVHFDYFLSMDEAQDKARYYLTHDTERARIAQNAFAIMQAEHSYEIRLRHVFDEIFHK